MLEDPGNLPTTRDGAGLFRQQVIDAQARRLHGDVILQQPLSTRLVTAIIMLVVVATGIWAICGSYARVEAARGTLVPIGGYSKIYALHPGIVTTLLVKEGDQVKAGQKLAVVRIEMPNAAGDIGTQQQLGSLDTQTGFAKRQVTLAGERSVSEIARLAGVVDGLRRQAATLAGQIALQQEIVTSMAASLAQIEPVVAKGYISKLEYERRRQALLGAQEQLSQLRQQADGVTAEIARTEKERGQAAIVGENDTTNARSALESYRQQRSRVEGEASYAITAPVSGRVTAVQTSIGRTVEGSRPMMILVPDASPLRADLYVPSRSIGFVRPGQEVRLLYDAFPYQRFGSYVAHVENVSKLAVAGEETDAPFKIDEPVYRVTALLDRQQVDAYGRPVSLQPGMTLMANIVLERQSFLDWLLDPLRAVSNRN